jgi:hypothetical protein
VWHDDDFEFPMVNGAMRAYDGRFWRNPEHHDSDTQKKLNKNVAQLLARAMNGDPTIALQAVAALKRRVEDLEADAVALAKSLGWSWRDVGDVLGMSRSGAQKRAMRRDRRGR